MRYRVGILQDVPFHFKFPGESHRGNLGLTLHLNWGSVTPLGHSLCPYTYMAEKLDTLSKPEEGFVLVPPL